MKESDPILALNHAAFARMKHAIAEAQQLVVVLDKIKNGKVPIQEMANARGTVAKLCQSVHEASAYFSAYETVKKNKSTISMSRPHKHKEERIFVRKERRKRGLNNVTSPASNTAPKE